MSLIAGKQAEDIVDLLDSNNYVNEFVISKKLDLTINQVRNILYKISDYGLVSSTRKKDKRKGWYIYFWKIEVLKALEFLKEELLKKIENIAHQINSRETKRFYVCSRCHIELNEENALLNNFTCSECGSVLALKDNTKLIKELRRTREKLFRDLKTVEEELEKERVKEEKKKAKERKKAEKKSKRGAKKMKKRIKRTVKAKSKKKKPKEKTAKKSRPKKKTPKKKPGKRSSKVKKKKVSSKKKRR